MNLIQEFLVLAARRNSQIHIWPGIHNVSCIKEARVFRFDDQVDLVLMGSYSGGLIKEIMIGSSLDYMLRESEIPLFICR